MNRVFHASCNHGQLFVHGGELDPQLEGKILRIMILGVSESILPEQEDLQGADSYREGIRQLIERSQKYSFEIPPDYKFDRDELYDR